MGKNLQLLGIGNSLVDLQYMIDNKELKSLKFKKGEMKLAEKSEQIALLKSLSHLKKYKCSGGSAANTIIAFSQLGGSAAYSSVLGKDKLGQFYASEFQDLGIELHSEYLEDESTGTCVVLITPDAERTMFTHLGASQFYSKNNISELLIARADWIYIEGYKFSEESSTEAIYYAKGYAQKHNTKIALTFSETFITDLYRNNLTDIVRSSDLVLCNETEVKSYTKCTRFDEAYEALQSECKNFAITRGAKGSKIRWEGNNYDIPAYKVNPIDSTGAGDAYAAGFLYGIVDTSNPELAGHLGSLVAAEIVSQMGARYQGDFIEIKNKIYEKYSN